MKLSIIIPVFNEERTIIHILKKINDNLIIKENYEVIVVNDASSDKTGELLDKNKNLYDKIIINSSNKGKGYSVKKGLEQASGTHVIFQDADMEYDPKDFKKFEKIFMEFDADGIIGSRIIYSEFSRSHNILNKIGNRILTSIFNILYNTTFTDIYSCYFAFKKELINEKDLKTNGFEQHAEILCKVIKKGDKFYEVPISYNGRNLSEGKKIRAYHFFLFLYEIIKQRF